MKTEHNIVIENMFSKAKLLADLDGLIIFDAEYETWLEFAFYLMGKIREYDLEVTNIENIQRMKRIEDIEQLALSEINPLSIFEIVYLSDFTNIEESYDLYFNI